MEHIFIQTNRAKIKELLSSFAVQATKNELFIAPRPLPKERFNYYTAFVRVNLESKNYQDIEKLNNKRIISKNEFTEKISDIDYFWEAQ